MLIYENIHPDLMGYYNTILRDIDSDDYYPHLHKCFEFICLLSGSAIIEIDNRTYSLKEGDAVLVLPSEIHALYSKNKCFAFVCIFSTTFIPNFCDSIKYKSAVNPIFRFEEYELFNTLQDKNADLFLLSSIFYRFAYYLNTNTTFIDKDKKCSYYISNILDYVEENFNQDISMKTLSKQLNYSYHYTSNLFSEIFNTNFLDLVNQYRIQFADNLLRKTDLSINDIAEKSGYKNLRSFMRNFSRYLGKTPNKIRNGKENK